MGYEEILELGVERKNEMLERGSFVVRGVVDREVAEAWFRDLKQFNEDNKANIGGLLSSSQSPVVRLHTELTS